MNRWKTNSRATYDALKEEFVEMMKKTAWHRANFIDQSENCSGNYLGQCKDCTNCYFLSPNLENCVNVLRGADDAKDSLDSIGPAFHSQFIYYSVNSQDSCYDNKFCCDMIQSKWMEYCAHCFQCEHCFGCCGLVGKKYYIFNTQFEPKEYEIMKEKIIETMKKNGEYGSFFPGYFAATPYEETISGFYWPLSEEVLDQYGFRKTVSVTSRENSHDAIDDIPDLFDENDAHIGKRVFWDDVARKPFQIQEQDIAFARELNVPLPSCYYARRLKENFRMIPFDGTMRPVMCAQCKTEDMTSWPAEYDNRIVCEKCYLKEVY
jgi:hypothetical protein